MERPSLPLPQPAPLHSTRPPQGPVLCFAPHPDDEVLGPGGALALHRQQGDPVHVILATDGGTGDPDGTLDRPVAEVRAEETRAALAHLDVEDVTFWGAPDGATLNEADLERAVRMASLALMDAAPLVVYLPWSGDGHTDHLFLHHAVMHAMRRVEFGGQAFGYEIWDAMVPDVLLDIGPVIQQKQAAVAEHKSQFRYLALDRAMEALNAYRSIRFAKGHGWFEAYQRLWPETSR